MRNSLNLSLFIILIPLMIYSQEKGRYLYDPVQIENVLFTDGFWQQRYETNRNITVPHLFKQIKKSGRLDNLLFATAEKDGEYCTRYPFDDSDIFKSIEAASYVLMQNEDEALESLIDSLILLISKVQTEDGYIYSARSAPSESIKRSIGTERWSNLQWSHELYNAGHLYEAAVAHYSATGKRELLDVAVKNADMVLNTFNPDSLQIPPGHQEIEIGLVKLYRVTGNKRYLDQAKYFLDIRGRGEELDERESWGEYAQDHLPPVEQTEAVGHAVRACYMFSSMTDIAALMNNDDYKNAVILLWENVTGKKLYVTGGVGATGSGEAFGDSYDLPNASAYNETCSSIANMMWNYRMFRLSGDSKYLDVFERTLYNAFLSGVGMEGNLFFYPNPLVSYGTQSRTEWFTCACCPPNIARFIASLPAKVYAVNGNNVSVNLYASNKAEIEVEGKTVSIEQITDYPWKGDVGLKINPVGKSQHFKLQLRVPGWAQEHPFHCDLYSFEKPSSRVKLLINGQQTEFKIVNGFIPITRDWKSGDQVFLIFAMDVSRVIVNEKVEADLGKVAIQLGPVVYCAEWVDNGKEVVNNLLLDEGTNQVYTFNPGLLGGINTITGTALNYHYLSDGSVDKSEQDLTMIPYYSWAHRGEGEMSVWLVRDSSYIKPRNGPTLIYKSTVKASSGENYTAVNDQLEPDASGDESVPFYHWWPNKGTEEWVEIDFPDTAEVSGVEIYWFDDTGWGECRIPVSWKVMYMDNETWREVYATNPYTVLKDVYSRVYFETVKTSSLRIIVQSQKDYAGGIHEIKLK